MVFSQLIWVRCCMCVFLWALLGRGVSNKRWVILQGISFTTISLFTFVDSKVVLAELAPFLQWPNILLTIILCTIIYFLIFRLFFRDEYFRRSRRKFYDLFLGKCRVWAKERVKNAISSSGNVFALSFWWWGVAWGM